MSEAVPLPLRIDMTCQAGSAYVGSGGTSYIIHRDEIGLQFAEALAEKARVDRPFGWISRENDSFGWNGGHYLTNSRPAPRTRLRHLFVQTLRSASRAQRLAFGNWPGGSANATEPS